MPRKARQYLTGYPYHIVQRGNNREACFLEPENYQFYLDLWQECSKRYSVNVHAYCLMTNHIHILATPIKKDSISNASKVVGSRYAQYMNKKYKRTGTLWEGRHRSSLLQSEKYLLTCYRYIELNPVRADMVESPEGYQWSSYGANAWGDASWITAHEEYLELGTDKQSRCLSYRELFKHHLDVEDLQTIRRATHYSHPVGDERFKREIEVKYGIKLGETARGRLRKGGNEVVKNKSLRLFICFVNNKVIKFTVNFSESRGLGYFN